MSSGSTKINFGVVQILILALMGIGVVSWVGMAWLAIGTARDMRVQMTQERNLTTARLTARLLDEQTSKPLMALGALARQPLFGKALDAGETTRARPHLQTIAEIVPDFLFVTAYRRDGTPLCSLHSSLCTETVLTSAAKLLRTVVGQSDDHIEAKIITSKDGKKTLALAAPVNSGGQHVGYLVAGYSLQGLQDWMGKVSFGRGSHIYVISSQGELLLSTGTVSPPASPRMYSPLREALTQHEGSGVERALQGGEQAVIGYAYSQMMRCAVIASLPLESALGPTNYLVQRLAILITPVFLMAAVAAGMLMRLSRRQHDLTQQLAAQNHDLQELDRMKSDFLATMSHDLKTPLAGMKVSLSGLLESDVHWEADQIHSALQLMNEEVDQLNARVRDLLLMARLEAGAMAPMHELCDLTDIVSSALERLRPLLDGRKICADFPPSPLLVECDQAQIETVVINLLENAAKYSPPEQPILLQGERRGGSVLLAVMDRGQGILPEEAARIFEKFYRAPRNHAIPGVGLGLSICKAIVQEHDGRLDFEPNPSGGAIFRVMLPAYLIEE